MVDQFGRNINYMRISVTDRCNLRCVYCMPEKGITSIEHCEILSYEEILRVVGAASLLGIENIKITGGEPLVRKDITSFVRRVKQTPGIKKVTLTTNGVLFPDMGEALADSGLDGVNFSLDSLDAQTFRKLTRIGDVEPVIEGIELALRLGLNTKLNCVPVDSYNHEDWIGLANLAKDKPLDVRFIEMMPIGLGRGFTTVSNAAVMQKLVQQFGVPIQRDHSHGSGPAEYWDFPGFQGSIGFISALSESFCSGCNRIRLTADGVLKPCLCFNGGVSLKPLLRSGASDAELEKSLADVIGNKPLHHKFNEATDESSETKNMVQIGG